VAGYQCSQDGTTFSACTSPKAYTLSDGTKSFYVKASDAAGNVSAAARLDLVIDTVAPVIAITSTQSTTNLSGNITFTITENGSGINKIQCSLDSSAFASCTSPYAYTVAAGSHNFQVQANDLAGNVSATVASSWTVSTGSSNVPMGQVAAARLLNQGTFGATTATINATAQLSYSQWFTQQQTAPVSLELPYFMSSAIQAAYPAPNFNGISQSVRNQIWLYNALNGQDQLRQRVAYALSEIFVTSQNSNGFGWNNGVPAVAGYMDLLANDAFGNFSQLLNDVTLNSYMGSWLTMQGNQGTNLPAGVHADENYAREIMQLFTIGLSMLNPDGSLQLNSQGQPIPTYSQAQVEDLARIFTGWGIYNGGGWQASNYGAVQYLNSTSTAVTQMIAYPSYHDTTSKTIVGGVVVPAGLSPAADMQMALSTIFNHPNVGPFIGRQLIQKLVTSNPSPAYVNRVTNVFNNDGTGVRGNMWAVVQAILTDPEAIGGASSNTDFGKLRESTLKMTHMYRAFSATIPSMNTTGWSNFFGGSPFMYWVLDALTVFNYYQPSFQAPGNITNANLVSPEFQVITDNTIVNVSESVDAASGVYQGSYVSGVVGQTDTTAPILNLTSWEAIASNPTTLVNQMNLVLMNGLMPAAMQNTLITYAGSISNLDQRIADLVDLIINSPQYSVQQ
jgi:uncharacterized protein (DUF1800 family)